MEIYQKGLKSMKIKRSLKGFEAKLAIKPCCWGETPNYVNQLVDARICPVLNNPLMTLLRTTVSRKEDVLK
jgi:hypothetical protein